MRLIDAGNDPGLPDKDGFTPLHFAAQQGNVEVTRVLIERGVPIDCVNKFGNTPLFNAVFSSRGEGGLISLLRDAGADPRRENKFGRSPVGLARLIANYDVRQFFEDVE
jgi:ankyrin repeat protein